MIDSHAHLIWDVFNQDLENIIKNSLSKNINKFIHPCVELKDFERMRELKNKYSDNIFLCAGVHPSHANSWENNNNKSRDLILSLKQEIIAIGEAGLDYFHKEISPEIQKQVFTDQCLIAKELDLPLVIHSRDAQRDTYEILKNLNITRGVVHCFNGSQKDAEEFLSLGLYIGIGGSLTFKNSRELRETVKNLPLEKILLETDCPFLAPQKYRGQRNEPAFLEEIALKLAEIKNTSLEKIDKITQENTENLFFKNI